MSGPQMPAWWTRAETGTRILAALAGAGLVVMMALVSVGVVLRYAFASPIVGLNELVQYLSAMLVMLALPWCTAANAHVRADILDGWLGRWGRMAGDVLARLLSIAVLVVLARHAWRSMAEAHEFRDLTNMMNLPIWPIYGVILIGAGLSIPVMALQIVLALRQEGAA